MLCPTRTFVTIGCKADINILCCFIDRFPAPAPCLLWFQYFFYFFSTSVLWSKGLRYSEQASYPSFMYFNLAGSTITNSRITIFWKFWKHDLMLYTSSLINIHKSRSTSETSWICRPIKIWWLQLVETMWLRCLEGFSEGELKLW